MMRPLLRQLSGVAATLLGALLALGPAFAEQPPEVPAQGAAAEQAPGEGAPAQQDPSDPAPPAEGAAEQTPPVEMQAPPREAPRGLEEIVVTAEKREASLQDTPIAVSAFTPETMKEFGIRNATDYTTLVPSLSFRVSPGRLYIRGVGRTDNSLGLDPGVAVYTDGIYSSETVVLNSSSFGTERMEILRGPQGTLYGRNTTGGAVNFISAKPEDEYHVEGRVRIGTYGTREYGLITTGPILTERLRFHVLASDGASDAHQKNYSGRDTGDNDARFYRAQLEADLTEDLTLWVLWNKLGVSQYATASARLTPYFQGYATPISFTPSFGIPGPQPGQYDIHTVDTDESGKERLHDTYGISGSLTWDTGPVILKYLYGFQTYDYEQKHMDFDGTPRTDGYGFTSEGAEVFYDGINQVLSYVREDKQYYSHELQISSNTADRLQWIGGLYYYNEEIEQPFLVYKPYQSNLLNLCLTVTIPEVPEGYPQAGETLSCVDEYLGMSITEHLLGWPALWNDAVIVPNVSLHGGAWPGRLYDQQGELKSEAYAAYGELYYDIDERLKLTAGLRYSYDRKHGKETQDIVADAFYFIGYDLSDFSRPYAGVDNCCGLSVSSQSRRLRDDWSALTGRLVLDFVPNDDSMAYLSISQGYKAGGFRLGSMTEYKDDPVFDPEQNLAFELGYKGTFRDRFRVNAAAFYYNYKDQQVLRSFYDEEGGITHASVINADKTIAYGLELETQARVTDELSLMANYSYNHGRFRDFKPQLDESYPDWDGDGNPGPDGIVDTDDDGPGPGDLRKVEGNDLVQTPEHKITLGATYSFFTDFGTFGLTGRWSWVDKTTYDIFNNVYAPSYSRLDYFVTYEDPDGRWTVIGYVKNATDEDNFSSYEMSPAYSGRSITGFPNLPRTAGVELLFRF